MINMKMNTQCNLIANYLYTDMNKAPEVATSTDVKTAMEALCFSGYTKSQFISNQDIIDYDAFDCIINHMWGIDSYNGR